MSDATVGAIMRDWAFTPSAPSLLTRLSRAKSRMTGVDPPPAWRAVRPVDRQHRWNCLFVYAPDGALAPHHRFALDRLQLLDGRLMVVIACPPDAMPTGLADEVDALYWKALGGYDFSAYAIALHEVAGRSPGADLYLQNDSVYGPLVDIAPLLAGSRWDLTGFMASAAIENHVQSYAFLLRDVTSARAEALAEVLPRRWACDRFRDVVNLQETRLARVAAKTMRVGALWYAADAGAPATGIGRAIARKLTPARHRAPVTDGTRDPSLRAAVELVEAGFPFLKRSLRGRYGHLTDAGTLTALLTDAGHPV